jgi:signal transduction histidine kinase/ligand-binding sensor domain-containing protein
MNSRHSAFLLAATFALISVQDIRGADLGRLLVDYTLTSWAQKDGMPSSVVRAIAQDSEGYLWLGTDAGPVRFDGARFSDWEAVGTSPLRKESVRALCAAADGSLWFGFGGRGGVARLRDGQVRNYGPTEGIPEGPMTLLFDDPAGTMWAGNDSGLYKFAGDRWEPSGRGLPSGAVFSAYVDKSGDFLVGTASGVFRRPTGRDAFERLDPFADAVRDMVTDGAGTLWITDSTAGLRNLHESRARQLHESGRGNRLLLDSQGNLWVGTGGQGLWRIQFDRKTGDPIVQKTTALAGFSDDGVVSLFQDAEGNVWAGTLDGLNRLTPHKMTPVTDLGVVRGIEVTPDGSAWVAGVDTIVRFPPGSVNQRDAAELLPGALTAMHADQRGTLWVATSAGLLRFDNGRKSVVRLPGDRPPHSINALAADPRGGLWISDLDQGLLRWNAGRLERFTLPPTLARSRVVATQMDRSGRLWLAFADDRVATIDLDQTVHVFGRENGLDAGAFRMMSEDHRGVMWLAGSQGLSRFADGRVSTVHRTSGFLAAPMAAIVQDDEHYLWIGAERPGAGMVRVTIAELEKTFADPTHQMSYRFFDKFDGFAGTPLASNLRAAARSKDGRLWLIAGRGITIIDPRTLPEGPAESVRVRIERVVADARRVPSLSESVLAPGTNRVEIDYAVLDLTSPLKTRFRYRLDGFDRDWIDAGVRRQAFYTNLPPRTYRFRVTASNDDGSWSEAAGVWAFGIQPRFFQTTWFLVACVALLVATVGAAWQTNVRRVRNQFSLLLRERARLSREIHDTLLQGLFGVALRCDALANSFDSSEPWLKDHFLQMRKDVQDYIDEARQSIQGLRSPRLVSNALTDALREAGERATAGTPVTFELAVRGAPRGCAVDVEHELLRIGQEAVLNAVRHAAAHRVQMEVRYDPRTVALRIADDGRGFDPVVVHGANGHYGLTSMKERAESVGGTLNISSAVGHGSAVEAIVPT